MNAYRAYPHSSCSVSLDLMHLLLDYYTSGMCFVNEKMYIRINFLERTIAIRLLSEII